MCYVVNVKEVPKVGCAVGFGMLDGGGVVPTSCSSSLVRNTDSQAIILDALGASMIRDHVTTELN